MLVICAKNIVVSYLKLDHRFGTTVLNAADDLFTFVINSKVSSTNNGFEVVLSQAIMQRKMHQKISTAGGKMLNMTEQPVEVLSDPTIRIINMAKYINNYCQNYAWKKRSQVGKNAISRL
ncbi:MAG: hypothetical protein EB830_00065 [Nitrosopumilus sp. H13]|nr:MAG: hypothetical protein EB830_00065 [Nitrosopumilus sp. H13]